MSSPAPVKTVTVTMPHAVATLHISTWQAIFAAIMAALTAIDPILINVLPTPVGLGLELGTAVLPIVIQTVASGSTMFPAPPAAR
jgi:hypothetical protein